MSPKWKDKNDTKTENVQETKTFMRWINFMIKKSSHTITNLKSDLRDGTVLCVLHECLTNIKVPIDLQDGPLDRVNAAIESFKADNVEICNDLGEFYCFSINIQAFKNSFWLFKETQRLVDGDTEAILKLIWSLITHYSISLVSQSSDSINMNGSNDSLRDK